MKPNLYIIDSSAITSSIAGNPEIMEAIADLLGCRRRRVCVDAGGRNIVVEVWEGSGSTKHVSVSVSSIFYNSDSVSLSTPVRDDPEVLIA